MEPIHCSKCGKDIHPVQGGLFQNIPDLQTWMGNVCTICKQVYCGDCIELGGPTPCPKCGTPTKPAQRPILQQIGALK